MGLVIAFASGKGGTGKSTVCAGIGSCLAAMGRKVLCIDCDAGLRNLDMILGMTDTAVVTYIDAVENGFPIEDAPEHPVIKGLFMLTAPYRAEYSPELESGFKALLLDARDKFDYVLLDAPAGIGEGFRFTVSGADRAVIVATCDPTSLRDGDKTERCLRALGIKDSCMAVNRVTKRLLYDMETTIDDAMDKVGLPLIGLVPEDEYVSLAAAHGQPLILCRRKGAAVAMLHMARRIEGIYTPLMKIK